jgi:hypothetical protein
MLVYNKHLLLNTHGMNIKVKTSIFFLEQDTLYIKTKNRVGNGNLCTFFGIPLQQIYLFSDK